MSNDPIKHIGVTAPPFRGSELEAFVAVAEPELNSQIKQVPKRVLRHISPIGEISPLKTEASYEESAAQDWAPNCYSRISLEFQMGFERMLKIQRKANGRVLLTLSGRIEAEDIDELCRLLELEGAGIRIALDLRDVTLVDRDAIRFLADCEADSIKLENCPPYVREWIGRESGKARRKKQ